MKFYRYLFCGESVEKKKKRIIRRLKYHRLQTGIYVITLPIDGKELLEIYHAVVLLQSFYRRKDIFVVGIAGSEEEACQIIERIVNQVYQETGACDIKGYICKNEEG